MSIYLFISLVLLALIQFSGGENDLFSSCAAGGDLGAATSLGRLARLEHGCGGALRVPRGYNRYVQPPSTEGGGPAAVAVGFVVSDVMEVSDQDYTISIKVRQ